MNPLQKPILVLLFGLCISSSSIAAQGQPSRPQAPTLDVVEEQTLLFMREEEKLARDVYRELYAKWGIMTFAFIADSEQNHMNSIGNMLDKYELEDPVTDDTTGVFTNPDLAELYEQLLTRGEKWKNAALKVGGYIEEVDIIDLENAILETDESRLQNVYWNLLNGSKNHLRAFVDQLRLRNVEYRPQVLDIETYNAIIAEQ